MKVGRVVAEQRNEVLASLLAELGWSPRVLAGRINRLFGAGTVAATAPYHWRDAGRVPRPPLPTLTAWVFAQELGRPVTVAELWQGKASDVALIMAADADMNTPWSRSALLGILDDWVMSGLLDRRQFLATSGAALAAATSGYLTEPGRLVCALQGGRAGHLLLDVPAEQRPTAVVAQSDLLALGAIRAAEDLGLRVPEDVSVTGFDGIDLPWYAGTLTTVLQHGEAKGRQLGAMVQAALAGETVADLVMPTELRVGTTTAPPATVQAAAGADTTA